MFEWVNLLARPVDPLRAQEVTSLNALRAIQGRALQQDEALKQREFEQKLAQQNALKQLAAQAQQGGGQVNPLSLLAATGDPRGAAAFGNLAVQQAHIAEATQKIQQGYHKYLIENITDPTNTVYDEALKKTGSPEAAQKAAQEFYTDAAAKAKSSGLLPPEVVAQMSPTYDRSRALANSMSYKDYVTQQREADRAGREHARLALDVAKLPVNMGDVPDGQGGTTTIRWQDTPQGPLDATTHKPIDTSLISQATNIRREGSKGQAAGAGLEQSKTLEILNPQGEVVRTVLAREGKGAAGWVDSATGRPLQLDAGQTLRQITPSGSGGGRAGAQVLRQQIAGREVLSDLQNAVTMPVGSTTGLFGNYVPGTSIAGTLQGDLVKKITTQDAQLMQASFASLSRELSILESPVYGGAYAAKQIDPLIPQAGDTKATTIFKMARIAQSADNALEAISKSPILSGEQKAYANDLRRQINTAIPWTASEALSFARQGKGEESFQDFMKRVKPAPSGAAPAAGGQQGAAPAMQNGIPTYSSKEQFDAHPPTGPWRKPDDPPGKVRMP